MHQSASTDFRRDAACDHARRCILWSRSCALPLQSRDTKNVPIAHDPPPYDQLRSSCDYDQTFQRLRRPPARRGFLKTYWFLNTRDSLGGGLYV